MEIIFRIYDVWYTVDEWKESENWIKIISTENYPKMIGP